MEKENKEFSLFIKLILYFQMVMLNVYIDFSGTNTHRSASVFQLWWALELCQAKHSGAVQPEVFMAQS